MTSGGASRAPLANLRGAPVERLRGASGFKYWRIFIYLSRLEILLGDLWQRLWGASGFGGRLWSAFRPPQVLKIGEYLIYLSRLEILLGDQWGCLWSAFGALKKWPRIDLFEPPRGASR